MGTGTNIHICEYKMAGIHGMQYVTHEAVIQVERFYSFSWNFKLRKITM